MRLQNPSVKVSGENARYVSLRAVVHPLRDSHITTRKLFFSHEVGMVQRHIHSKNSTLRTLVFFCLLLILWSTIPAFSQSDTLKISFQQVSIQDTTVYRGVAANFPNPVMSRMTIQDKDGRYVHGLADTSRWLAAQDTNQLGLLIDDVWEQIFEYHQEDPSIPVDPDVKKMEPDYKVIESYDSELTLGLVMDYSGSMLDGIYDAEDAARILLNIMSSNDQAAIVKFTGKVHVFQDFTSDSTLLMEAITRSPADREYTALYDAIFTTLNLSVPVSGRRVIIAYTDGVDNYSNHRISDVIDLAQEQRIPIYTIGLGPGIDESDLRQIAEETGGVYSFAETVEELADIYISIYSLVQGHYWLAHTTTDPMTNGTWRVIDLNLRYEGIQSHGKGYYFVPFIATDLSVEKHVTTDSIFVAGNDTLHYALSNDTLSYQITVKNNGPGIAGNLSLVDFPDDSTTLLDFEGESASITQDSMVWQIPILYEGESVNFRYRERIDTIWVSGLYPIENTASIRCDSDTILSNNSDTQTVQYLPLIPVDVVVSKWGVGDSVVVAHGDSVWYVYPGNVVQYDVSLRNVGELDCENISVRDVLPEDVELIDFTGAPFSVTGDTIQWTVPGLSAHGGQAVFSYSCRVDTAMPPWNVPLVNTVTAVCAADSNNSNNTAQDTVWAVALVPPDPQVRVDPETIHPADTVRVDVWTPVSVNSWDLRIYFENGTTIETYGDAFVDDTELVPGVWTTVIPDFTDTWMTTSNASEQVGVILTTSDGWGVVRADTAFFSIGAQYPQIRVSPTAVQPGDSVQVEVNTPHPVDTWDLLVYYEDGDIVTTYADDFILATELVSDIWTVVVPDLYDTWMRTSNEEERIVVAFQTINVHGIIRSDTASVLIRGTNEFWLDDNVYKPDGGIPLGMRFKLSSNRNAVIKVYDISGAFVDTVIDGPYNGGWNYTVWDGVDGNGRVVGTGVYVAILTSGSFQQMRKFIVVR